MRQHVSPQGDRHDAVNADPASGLLSDCVRWIGHRVIDKSQAIEQLLIAFLVEGHCLFDGDAGTGKSLLADQFARCLGLTGQRIVLSPDLEISEFIEQLDRRSDSPNDLSANVLLAEGIEHASPKLRALIVDVPSRGVIRTGRESYKFPRPLMLLASHDRLRDADQGLSSGQADQFLFEIPFRNPNYDTEYGIVESVAHAKELDRPALMVDVHPLRQAIQEMRLPPPVVHYVLRLVRSTRVYEGEDHDFVLEFVQHGAGPRAVESLLMAAKARAALYQRTAPTADDVRSFVHVVLRHRIVLNANAAKNGVTNDALLDRLVAETPQRVPGDESPPPGYRQKDNAS